VLEKALLDILSQKLADAAQRVRGMRSNERLPDTDVNQKNASERDCHAGGEACRFATKTRRFESCLSGSPTAIPPVVYLVVKNDELCTK